MQTWYLTILGLMLRASPFQQNSKLSTTILTGRGHDFFNDATFLLSPLAWPITIHKCRSASTSVDENNNKKHHLIGFRYTTTKQVACEQALLFERAKRVSRERASEW